MASSVNIVLVMGNLTRDPEMKYTGGGTAVCDMSVALNYTTGKGDQKKEEVSFVDVVAFGKTAETAAEYLKKGRSVHIQGRLQQDRWEDKENGQKRSKLKVIAERITFVGGKGAAEAAAPVADGEVEL